MRLPNLDLLRLGLALEVAYIHSFMVTRAPHPWIPVAPVAAFVCLSGYLIPASLERSRNIGHFAWKRVLRVYPAFFASIALCVAIMGWGAVPSALISYATLGIVWMTANPPLWSLMLEELCYASHVVARVRKWWNLPVVIGVGAAFSIIAAFLPMLGMYKVGIVTAFFAGNAVYLLRDKIGRMNAWVALSASVAAICVYKGLHWQSFMAWVPSVAALILALKLPQVKWRMPDLSYGVYVYNWPVLWWLREQGVRDPWAMVGWSCILTIAAATLSWYLIEKPCLRLRDWRPRRSRSAVPIPA